MREEIAGQSLILVKTEEAAGALAPAAVAARGDGQEGRMLHIYGPRVVIGKDLKGATRGDLESNAAVQVTLEPVEEVPEDLSEAEFLGLSAWNLRLTEDFDRAKAERPREGEPWDLHEPPDGEGMVHGEPPPEDGPEMAAPAPDMSSFLIGSVAVGIVIVEGPTAALQFSQQERIKVVAEVQEGLSWLALQEPRAGITWSYDIHTVRVDAMPNTSLTGYEPLESLWRNPAMQKLGFAANFQGVIDYAASLRTRLGTRWGYVGFFTKYPLHHFAYASKPRLVMHYENDGWGVDNIDQVFTHESGHIFGCPDEYARSNCNCTDRFGFLRERNGNCQPCATDFIPCLMAENTKAICPFTAVHLGWRDSDGDGVLDPVDTSPA